MGSTTEKEEKKALLKKAEETWAMNVLRRVKEGAKVTHNDIERATVILGGGLDDDNADAETRHEAVAVAADIIPRFAKNQTELAGFLKVERKTIQRWKKEPHFPKAAPNGRIDAHAVRDWALSRGKKIYEGVNEEEEKYQLEVRRLKAICESLELKLAIDRGEYLPVRDVYEEVSRMASAVKIGILKIRGLAPSLAPLENIKEIQDRLQEEIDEVLRGLSEDPWLDKIDKAMEEYDEEDHS